MRNWIYVMFLVLVLSNPLWVKPDSLSLAASLRSPFPPLLPQPSPQHHQGSRQRWSVCNTKAKKGGANEVGSLKARALGFLLPGVESWSCHFECVTLGKQLRLCQPQFPQQFRDNSTKYQRRMFRWDEVFKCPAQRLTHGKGYLIVRYYY